MSTATDRAIRAQSFVLPVKFSVKQSDGSSHVQHVDTDVRKPVSKGIRKLEEDAACQEVRRAINEYYYGQ